VKSFFRTQDKLINANTRGKQWLTLVRFPLIFELLLVHFFLLSELLLVRFPLHLELFSELGIRFLEGADLCFVIGDAPFQGGELLVITHNDFQLLRFLLGVGDHILYKEGNSDKQLDSVYQQESTQVIPWQSHTPS
jgi:hypothetical protein